MRNGKEHGSLLVRALRGSSWSENDTRFAECASRGFLVPEERSDAIGFRVSAPRRLTLP